MRWYVSKAGTTLGPLDESAVRKLASSNGLDGCQVRDEAGGAWMPAKASPFGSLMKERGLVGPLVAGAAVWLIATVFIGGITPSGSPPSLGIGFVAGLLTFGLLAVLRRL